VTRLEEIDEGPDPLAALLVARGLLPATAVEEAQERQVLLGGALDTALLELQLVEEAALLEACGQAYATSTIGLRELAAIDKGVTTVFPRRLVEKHGAVPIQLAGRRLTVAVAGAPDMALLDEIGFMLSMYVKPASALEARIAWAAERLYGLPIPPRLKAVLGRLGEGVGDPIALPPSRELWRASSVASDPGRRLARVLAEERRAESVAASAPAAIGTVVPDEGWAVASRVDLPLERPSAPALGLAGGGSIAASVEADALARAEHAEREAIARRRTERVLWTVDDAIAELALADGRDVMLDVVLRFAYRRLQTAAIFVLHRLASQPVFVGWDVIDPLLEKKDLAAFSLPAEGSSALAQVASMRSPFLGPLKPDDPLARLFGRQPRATVLVPILVGDRLLGVIYGDCGVRSIPPSSLAELHMVVPRLGRGLANLILRQKKALRSSSALGTAPAPVAGLPGIEAEADIAVDAAAAPAPLSIDIDVIEIEDAVQAGFSAPTELAVEPPATDSAWADGRGDDEDVRLDAATLAVLTGDPRERDAGLELPRLDARAVAEIAFDVQELPANVLQAVPSAAAGSMEAPSHLSHALSGEPGGEPTTMPSLPAPSPGARARESLLLAAWHGWMHHEAPDLDELVSSMRARPSEAARKLAIHIVVSHGERAMPSLARYFPGVLEPHPFGPSGPGDARPEVEAFSDCLACLAKLGPDLAAPILVAELAHADRLHRYAATWALSAIRVPAALPRLAQRVFDAEPRIAHVALDVLDGYRDEPAFEKVLAQIRDLLRRGDVTQRERAVLAAAWLKDRAALPALVDLLAARPKELAEEARRALVEIARQDFGTSERRWRAWIADHEAVPRTRWLIDALTHKDEEIRKGAQTELNRLTGQYFGYRFDASRSEREHGVREWQEWWARQEGAGARSWP
jgi:hypothetical protein